MEEVIKTFKNLGFTMRKLNTKVNNREKFFKIVNDIMKKNNKIMFYIIDLKFIKQFASHHKLNINVNDNCMIMCNLNGDDTFCSNIILNYNDNEQIKHLEKQFILLLKNELNNECCICFEKKEYRRCTDCINVVCLDCLNKMVETNKVPACPCCRKYYDGWI